MEPELPSVFLPSPALRLFAMIWSNKSPALPGKCSRVSLGTICTGMELASSPVTLRSCVVAPPLLANARPPALALAIALRVARARVVEHRGVLSSGQADIASDLRTRGRVGLPE